MDEEADQIPEERKSLLANCHETGRGGWGFDLVPRNGASLSSHGACRRVYGEPAWSLKAEETRAIETIDHAHESVSL